MTIISIRGLRLTATSVVLGASAFTLLPQSAFAAGTTWRELNPGDTVNSKPTDLVAPGYAVDGLLGFGEEEEGRYKNFQSQDTGAYCLIAGLPASQAASLTNALDGKSDPTVAYAMSMYGDSTDRDTTAAVALISHIYLDQGTDQVSAADRRAAFQDAEKDAPAGVQAKVDQIVREAQSYKAPSKEDLATEVTTTGSVAGGDLAANVNTPEGHASVVTLSGNLTFEDGSQSKKIDKDTVLKLVTKDGAKPGSQDTITVDPVDDNVKIPATEVQAYRQDGNADNGRPYQIMGWAVPTKADLKTAQAKVDIPQPMTIGTTATDKADGDKYLPNTGGTIDDKIAFHGATVGQEITFTGVVQDAETGKPLLNKDGKEVTASVKYTPTTADGTADVDLALDATSAGKTLVVFETATDASGKVIAEHKDLKDQGQTVYVGKVGTNAADQADGDKVVVPGGTIVDVADYSNLPGGTTTVDAQLVDKATGKAVDGATGSTKVDIKEREAAQVKVSIKVPESAKDGQYVVFETFKDAKGNVVGEHKDLNSKEQTVTVKAPEQPSKPSQPAQPGTPAQPGAPVSPAPVTTTTTTTTVASTPKVGAQVHTGGDAKSQTALGAGLGLTALAAGATGLVLRRRKRISED